jgi:HEAT repeat protein
MRPQKQAEVLVQRAINHYEGAIEQIAQRVPGWHGRINLTPEFTGMLKVAQNSNDLRVRAAAIEVFLAAYDMPKDSGSFYQLLQRAQDEAGARPWALWMLGALGNRGVEPDSAFETLRKYARDHDEETRYWAVAGLGLLGTNETIAPLLDIFHNDPSARIREHAACNLAQSGMLTHGQRMSAVPELLKFMDDPSLDPATQGWVYQALRDITGEWFGQDPAAWRNWWAARSR